MPPPPPPATTRSASWAGGADDLQAWIDHLDALGIEQSPIITALAGQLLIFPDPDKTFLRLLTLPEGGIQAITMKPRRGRTRGPWIAPDIMRHP